jgi:hypothetical protein
MFSFDVRDRGDEELRAWRRAMAAAGGEGDGGGEQAQGERKGEEAAAGIREGVRSVAAVVPLDRGMG